MMRRRCIARLAAWGTGLVVVCALAATGSWSGPSFAADTSVTPASRPQPDIMLNPPVLKGRQGDVVTLTLTLPVPDSDSPDPAGGTAAPSGRLAGHDVPFFRLDKPDRFGALVGFDIDAPTGKHTLTVTVGDRTVATVPVVIAAQHFPTQTLTVPDAMVHLDEASLTRAKQEQKEVLASMAPVTPSRWWSGPFVVPTEGAVMNSFGKRRIINGEPRNPHTGEDFSAPKGSKVVAANDGVISLVGDHFFSGHSIFINHGDGLYTMYFHLSKVLVAPAQHVRKGEVIGLVGSSGRATGPHLHWGARLNGARINPLELTHLAFK
jgi:murein DD-endopeptidase MepM/ murein hydrolase activator NlpD